MLNIAAFAPKITTLGPGIRAGIWVRGCRLACVGCITPEWQSMTPALWIPVEKIAARIIRTEGLRGITISGGEPFLQAKPLADLLNMVRREKDLDVICFTGFLYKNLLTSNLPGVSKLLSLVDVLIDGPYMQDKNTGVGLRGSENQKFIHLTNRLDDFNFEEFPRQLEVNIFNNDAFVIGIPPQFSTTLS